MVGKQWTSDVEKAKIIAWRGEGVKVKDIITRSGRSRRTIERILRSAKDLPPNILPLHKRPTGRKRVTSRKTDKFLKLVFIRQPFMTVTEVKLLHPDVFRYASIRTLRRRLQKDLGLPCRRAARKPLITEKMRKKRLEFCKRYKNFLYLYLIKTSFYII